MSSDSLNHLALIMDGNRRWAKKNRKSNTDGHRSGVENMAKLLKELFSRPIPFISIYAFSLDNWQRDSSEVNFLHSLIKEFYEKNIFDYQKENIKVFVSGVLDFLPKDTISYIQKVQKETETFTKGVLNICFNYSGRREIVEAVKKISEESLTNHNILKTLSVDSFKNYLHNPSVPDVDLLIRTSGEYRISDFLIYQSAYSEYYFTNTLWPDLEIDEVNKAINSFLNRERRFGS